MVRGPVTRFSRNHKKLVISGISCRFHGLQHTVLGSDVDLNGPRYDFLEIIEHFMISGISGRFRGL